MCFSDECFGLPVLLQAARPFQNLQLVFALVHSSNRENKLLSWEKQGLLKAPFFIIISLYQRTNAVITPGKNLPGLRFLEGYIVASADINIAIAFGAGLVSFFSPCVLPLIPAYLGSMGALAFPSAGPDEKEIRGTGKAVYFTAAFVLGFSLVFILLGISAGLAGGLVVEYRDILFRVGGVVVIVFGLQQLGLIRIGFLERSLKGSGGAPKKAGFLSSFIMGALFSLGWTPCVGPVLASILLLAMGTGSPFSAGYYLVAYSAGMAIPFMLIAVFMEKFMQKRKTLNRYLPWIGRISGILLLFVGFLLISGLFLRFASIVG